MHNGRSLGRGRATVVQIVATHVSANGLRPTVLELGTPEALRAWSVPVRPQIGGEVKAIGAAELADGRVCGRSARIWAHTGGMLGCRQTGC